MDNYQYIDNYICHTYYPPAAPITTPDHLKQQFESTIGDDGRNTAINDKSPQDQSLQPTTTTTNNTVNHQPPHQQTNNNNDGDGVIITGADLIDDNAIIVTPKLHQLHGILFFGSTRAFNAQINPLLDPEFIIIDCNDVLFTDYSASTALCTLVKTYSDFNKRCKIVNVHSLQSQRTLLRDKALGKVLSRINPTTYVVMTAYELEQRRKAKEIAKKSKRENGQLVKLSQQQQIEQQ